MSPNTVTHTELVEDIGTYNTSAMQLVSDSHRAEFGQYMTPPGIAQFMASMFSSFEGKNQVRLLDAGAGAGILTAAVISRLLKSSTDIQCIESHAYEVDPAILNFLRKTIARCSELVGDRDVKFCSSIRAEDFICSGVKLLQKYTFAGLPKDQQFSHIILNPPYKKIRSNSKHRLYLRDVHVETTNLYTAFLAVAIKLLAPGGELVAITPRSFCNGVYFKPFRELLSDSVAIRHIHIFDKRDQVFGQDDVLQENIIFHCVKGGDPGDVTISVSDGADVSSIRSKKYSYAKIIKPDDADLIIHIPTKTAHQKAETAISSLPCTLEDLTLQVSTGPVVDFRLKEYLRHAPESGTVPLVYPTHFNNNGIKWPIYNDKKPNAIVNNEATQKWLMPNGHYTFVRRFSSKEEKRRVVAVYYNPDNYQVDNIGIENHINVFHSKKNGLTELIARGLMIYLNSTLVDTYFRQFSGHTQVNASDLRMLKYPSIEVLKRLGILAKEYTTLNQKIIDSIIERELL